MIRWMLIFALVTVNARAQRMTLETLAVRGMSNRQIEGELNRIGWSQDGDAYRVIFLVGDAPPHMD